MNTPDSPADGPVRRQHAGVAITLIIAGLSMFGPLSIDTSLPAFKEMGADFAVGDAAMQQVVSVYLFAFGAMSIVHGPLSDALGRRPVMIGGMIVYVLASIGCAFSPNLGVLLLFRAMQGFSAGAGTVVSRAVVRDLFEGHEAQRLMSHTAMLFGLAPAIAPVLGGWLLTFGGWSSTFWFLAAFAAVMGASVLLVLTETHPASLRTPLRLGAVAGNLTSIARSAAFWRISLATTLTFSGQFLYIAGAPIFMVELLGKGSQDFWMLFVPMIGGVVLGSFLSGRLAGRIAGRTQVMAGTVIALTGAVTNTILALTPLAESWPWAVVGPSVIALGVALMFPVLQLAILDTFPHARGSASSAASFVQVLFSGVVAGVIVPVVSDSVLTMAVTALGIMTLGLALLALHMAAGRARLKTTPQVHPAEVTDLPAE